MTFDVVLMICALGQSPAECQPPTARSVMVLERGVTSELACMREFALSSAKVASLIDPAHEFPKLSCSRVDDDTT